MSAASAASLAEAATAWDRLADSEINAHRKSTYERTAESLRIQIRSGVAVCVCCFKPLGGKPSILMSQDDIDAA